MTWHVVAVLNAGGAEIDPVPAPEASPTDLRMLANE